MPLRSDAYYRQLVESELRAAGVTEPPVALEAVAEHLGIPIRAINLPIWFTAALIYEDGLPAILLNASRPMLVRQVGLGHVLGHILVVLDDGDATYPRGREDNHRVADMLATEFLTPGYLVRDQAQKWFNDYRYLAGLFGVPESQMFEAMRDLGLIKSRGVVWDY